ncbi:hypothetical protein JKF63_02600 [Porcisia hertigi]|uniref:Aquaporin-like protein n=1 Tax=Porcisia hertigi TaxID=2761500 RepID=A0A836HRI3_9TRYP|nr:hypothetical protein JKF63_02600 [Porcisia hertigi]
MASHLISNANNGAAPLESTDGWSTGVPTAVSFCPPMESGVYPTSPPPPGTSEPTANGFGAAAVGESNVIHVVGREAEDVNFDYQAPLPPPTPASASVARWTASKIPSSAASLASPPLAMAGEWRGGGAGDITAEPKASHSRTRTTPAAYTREGTRNNSVVIDPTEVPALKYTMSVLVTRDGKAVEEQLDPIELGRLYGQKQAALRKLQSRYDFLAVPPWVQLHPELGAYLSEVVGTFAWVLTMALVSVRNGSIFSVSNDTNMTPLAMGFMLTSMIFTFGYISGAHLNPAVSIAVFLVREMKLAQCCAYILCQLAASLAAGVVAMLIQGDQNVHVPSVSNSYISSGVFSELIFTFAICIVVLNVAYSRQSGSFFYGFAAGMTMAAGSASVGHISGGAFNPAVATGLQLSVCLAGSCDELMSVWIYWLAPLVGAALAAILFSQMTQPTDTQVLDDRKVFQDANQLHRQCAVAQARINEAAARSSVGHSDAGNDNEAVWTSPSASSPEETLSASSNSFDSRRSSEMRVFPGTGTLGMREERGAEDVPVRTEAQRRGGSIAGSAEHPRSRAVR